MDWHQTSGEREPMVNDQCLKNLQMYADEKIVCSLEATPGGIEVVMDIYFVLGT